MNGLDIVILVLLGWGTFRGFSKGLFVELAALTAFLLGIYGAIHFSNYASDILDDYFNWNQNTLNIAAFGITFIIIVLAVTLAGKALTQLANFAALGLINKLLGAFFGLIKFSIIISVCFVIFEKINNTTEVIQEDTLNKSTLYTPIKQIVPTLFPSLLTLKNTLEKPDNPNVEATQ